MRFLQAGVMPERVCQIRLRLSLGHADRFAKVAITTRSTTYFSNAGSQDPNIPVGTMPLQMLPKRG